MIDQIETLIQLKIDKCYTLIHSYQDRLAKAKKETQRAHLSNQTATSERNKIQKMFEETIA
jgi:hypothetical protein